MPSYYSSSFASILIAALSTPAFAQEGQPAAGTTAVAERQGVISYTPADFAVSRPNTALEMINRLPGFTFESNDQVRGFAGAAGNVLIDGQRPTIKTDSLADTLGWSFRSAKVRATRNMRSSERIEAAAPRF